MYGLVSGSIMEYGVLHNAVFAKQPTNRDVGTATYFLFDAAGVSICYRWRPLGRSPSSISFRTAVMELCGVCVRQNIT